MTGASKGLQKSLARAGGSVIAIAEMHASDILANLTEEQKASLAASLAPAAATPAPAAGASDDPAPEPAPEPTPASAASGSQASADDTRAAERARMQTVLASDKVKGREAAAMAMLANDEFASVSADGILAMLDHIPAGAAEDADGKAMLAAMIAGGNANLGTSTTSSEPQQEANHGWDKIHAEMRERRG